MTVKIQLDQARCVGNGICVAIAPDHFEFRDDGTARVVKSSFTRDESGLVEEAVLSCPTEAIRLNE